MATFSGLAVVRDDFRCSLCQRKNAFHCEHDTPYRDQLLGTYDQEKPRMSASNSRRESHRTSSHIHNNNLSNHNTQQKITTEKMLARHINTVENQKLVRSRIQIPIRIRLIM